MIDNLLLGFSVALTPINMAAVLVGATLGTLIGVLPGIGPIGALAMLIPLTYYVSPETAVILLAGLYYGSQYGGSTTAILMNMPGESSSVVTCLDGHKMALQGRAGAALAIAALASLFGGLFSMLVVAFAAAPLASFALTLGPAEYFSLMALGIVAAVIIAQGSLVQAFGMVALGLIFGVVGTDINSGSQRLTFGLTGLSDGIPFVSLAIGLFAIPEIVRSIRRVEGSLVSRPLSRLWPTRDDFRKSWPAAVRGTVLGSLLGMLPGGGTLLASFGAYGLEKRMSRTPEEFGRGAVQGVAAPEAANNAGAQTSFIPLLTLGIPGTVFMALLAGALMVQGITPSPQIITNQPELFWGLIASMFIGNIALVIINLPLIRIWVALLSVPYRIIYPTIIIFCCIGVYTVNYSLFDVYALIFFAFLGEVFSRLDCEPAPFILAFLLGPMMEENLRRAFLLNHGDASVLVTRPLSLTFLLIAAVLLASMLLPHVRAALSRYVEREV